MGPHLYSTIHSSFHIRVELIPRAPATGDTRKGSGEYPLGGVKSYWFFCSFKCIFEGFHLYFGYQNGFWDVSEVPATCFGVFGYRQMYLLVEINSNE